MKIELSGRIMVISKLTRLQKALTVVYLAQFAATYMDERYYMKLPGLECIHDRMPGFNVSVFQPPVGGFFLPACIGVCLKGKLG